MLEYNYDINVESAYIIRIEGNEISERMADRCATSCEKVGMPYKFFKAVDGTKDKLILPEDAHPIVNLIKLSNTHLTQTELACVLSHFLLWVKSVELDKPIVILEHDVIMLRPYLTHPFFNIIGYLGGSEQIKDGWETFFPIPPHAQLNSNFRFICRAHAYCVDPMISRQMVAKLIKTGITAPADIFIRIDEFAILQDGLYAYNEDASQTTITGRDEKESNAKIVSEGLKLETL